MRAQSDAFCVSMFVVVGGRARSGGKRRLKPRTIRRPISADVSRSNPAGHGYSRYPVLSRFHVRYSPFPSRDVSLLGTTVLFFPWNQVSLNESSENQMSHPSPILA